MSTKRGRTPEPAETLPPPPKSRKQEYAKKTMSRMAKRGDLEGITGALDECGRIPHHSTVQYKAAECGQLPILELIYDKYVKDTGGSTCFRDEDEMQAALRSGSDETIRWMCRHYRELFCLVEADEDDDDENSKVGPNDIGRAHGRAQSWLTSAKLWDLSKWAYTELGLEYDEISMRNIIYKNNVKMVRFAVECGAKIRQATILDALEDRSPNAVQEYKRLKGM